MLFGRKSLAAVGNLLFIYLLPQLIREKAGLEEGQQEGYGRSWVEQKLKKKQKQKTRPVEGEAGDRGGVEGQSLPKMCVWVHGRLMLPRPVYSNHMDTIQVGIQ